MRADRYAVRLVLIAAMSRDRVLSKDGRIPWDVPEDRGHFRARAAGRWLLVGRRTYAQMEGWFRPGQVPLVLTRGTSFPVPGGRTVASVPEAMDCAAAGGADELLVIGGGEVYQAALPLATEVILTIIEVEAPGDVFFPELPAEEWQLAEESVLCEGGGGKPPARLTVWRRISGNQAE